MKFLALSVLLSFAALAGARAGDWVVVGAGNATCTHWNAGKAQQQTEILSWMAGFASAMNLNLASEGQPEFRLEYLTYEYLRAEIKAACSEGKEKDLRMSGILFSVLKKLPQQPK